MKLNRSHSRSQAQFQTRLTAQRLALQGQLEQVDSFPEPESSAFSIFKSSVGPAYESVDELVTAGNREFAELDLVNFAHFRNNKELGQRTLEEVSEQLASFHPDQKSPEFREDLSRVMNARYLQGHGVKVEAHLDAGEMRDLRKYLQKETSTYNVADAVRSLNSSLKDGVEDVSALKLGAEKHLFTERGLPGEQFDQRFAQLGLKDLAKVRNFSDAWSTSQGGKFLRLTQGKDFTEHRDSMAREMLAAQGYKHVNSVDLDTVLSLLRDIDAEGPRTNAAIRESVNRSLAAGEKDYFVLNTRANEAILQELGMSGEELRNLDVSDEKLSQAYPDSAPREARAIRTRVLRDLVRVLPPSERELAKARLQKEDADLVSAESVLKNHLGSRISALSADSIDTEKMGAMQRANLATALQKLPEEMRFEVFTGPAEQIRNSLEQSIESRFGIEVHREAGKAPDGNAGVAPFVKDWTVQGLVDLYNAMEGMAKDGKLPETLIGHSTIAYVEGGEEGLSMAVGPQTISSDPVGPWNRPGAFAHASGTSGYYGMCSPDETGHDTVYFCDDALMGTNSDSAESVTIGESTIIHEFGHAIQLGGTPGADKVTRGREQQVAMAEWSALSNWTEPKDILADGLMGSFEYYYDPSVQVDKRHEVATSYGASDPCEDYAEYTPFFFKAPEVAMKLSPEKFLYFNDMVGGFYSQEQTGQVASKIGLDEGGLNKALVSMQKKVAAATLQAGIKTA